MFVKPRKGMKILRPDTGTVLLECGEHVPKTSFWIRRLKDEDVSIVETPKKSAPVSKKSSKKKEQQKADLADSAQFKGFDKVVVAELHFDDDDVKKSGFDLPYDAEKTCACGVRGSTPSTQTP